MFHLELFIHPMCPFAQRCLYILSFKQINATVREVDLSDKPSWFLQEVPEGYLPALIVRTGNSRILLHESLVICEFLESLPGINLYPRSNSGTIDALKKAVIDMNISTNIEPLKRAIRIAYWNKEPNKREFSSFQRLVKTVNSLVPEGRFFEFKLFGEDRLGYLDLIAISFIDRIIAFRAAVPVLYEGLDIRNLIEWHSRVTQFKFIQDIAMPLTRYTNLRKQMQAKKYKGLRLPATLYDSDPNI